jgi:hypothetical protein
LVSLPVRALCVLLSDRETGCWSGDRGGTVGLTRVNAAAVVHVGVIDRLSVQEAGLHCRMPLREGDARV